MAQRGYPGIHAGMPTAQCLRSAVVVNGARRSKAKQKQGGLIADLSLSAVELNLWEQSLLAMAPDLPRLPRRRLLRFQTIQRPLHQQLNPIGHATDRQGNATARVVDIIGQQGFGVDVGGDNEELVLVGFRRGGLGVEVVIEGAGGGVFVFFGFGGFDAGLCRVRRIRSDFEHGWFSNGEPL